MPPDLLAGTRLLALDTPQTASDEDSADELAFISTSYIAGGTTVGAAFVAPTSGRVMLFWAGRLEHNGTGIVLLSAAVRLGATLGAGTSVSASSDDSAITTNTGAGGTDTRLGASYFRPVTGLTPGTTYNAITEHKVTSGNADIFNRSLVVLAVS